MTSVFFENKGLLSSLLKGICYVSDINDRHVTDITSDSREVTRGSCFFALEGSTESGSDYANDAVNRGAVAIIYEKPPLVYPPSEVAYFVVPKVKETLGEVSKRFFGNPSKYLNLYAVTGTNGKTTVSYLISKALGILEGTCGYIGTLGLGLSDSRRLTETQNTTPDIITINRALKSFVCAGANSCALEASSIGISQGRLTSLDIDTALYTNLGHDHLDFHGTWSDYGRTKMSLFQLESVKNAIVNIDDEFGRTILDQIGGQKVVWSCSCLSSVSLRTAPKITATGVVSKAEGTKFTLNYTNSKYILNTSLVGMFNVANLLLVIGALLLSGYEIRDVRKVLKALGRVPGRMECCGITPNGALVFVDYAHTPDGLKAALSSLRALTDREVCVVFGCGGGRDKTKRPIMGSVAYELADSIILTSDNSREEKTKAIINDILIGIRKIDKTKVVFDRVEAISTAIDLAQNGDIILVAGKGHEIFQELDGKKFKCDDRAEIRKFLSGVVND